eukprot:9313816-Ditylum_brightwellii.AAC.1
MAECWTLWQGRARQDSWHSAGHKGTRYGLMLGTDEVIAPMEYRHISLTSQGLKVQSPEVRHILRHDDGHNSRHGDGNHARHGAGHSSRHGDRHIGAGCIEWHGARHRDGH